MLKYSEVCESCFDNLSVHQVFMDWQYWDICEDCYIDYCNGDLEK